MQRKAGVTCQSRLLGKGEHTVISKARSFGRVSLKCTGSCKIAALTMSGDGGASIAEKATMKSLTSLGVSRGALAMTYFSTSRKIAAAGLQRNQIRAIPRKLSWEISRKCTITCASEQAAKKIRTPVCNLSKSGHNTCHSNWGALL